MRPVSQPHLQAFIASLAHVGSAGFEGLVAALLAAATGQRFRLSGSGQQDGQDMRSEPGPGNRLKAEAKHYRKASLNLRELEGELLQAAGAQSDLDLWVLVTTCQLDDNHARKLEAHAADLHVEVLFIDASGTLPRLHALIARYKEAMERWADQHGVSIPREALQEVEEILSDPQLQPVLDELFAKLRGTLLGYDDAVRRSHERFLGAMRHRGESRALFSEEVALLDEGSRPIERLTVQAAMDGWWNAGAPGKPKAVVLAEEGMGKTWAAAHWMLRAIGAGVLPLLVPLNGSVAEIGDRESLESFLPKYLAQWLQYGTPEYWQAKLQRWLSAPGDKPLVAILADGLNERPDLHWPRFFLTLGKPRWATAVAVLATDRTGHWIPSCAMAGLTGFHEVHVAGYSDSELRQALAGTTVQLDEIGRDLEALIRTPRYCRLVAEHFDEMKREADATVERLLFIDMRARCAAKIGHPFTSELFVELLQKLAAKHRQLRTLTRDDIGELIAGRDRDGRIYQEILDGGLLIRKPGPTPLFEVDQTRLIYGLGMLIAERVREAAGNAAGDVVEAEIASWLEPSAQTSLKVRVCGSALFHALLNADYPPAARRELLRYWLAMRNWTDELSDAALPYIRRCPEDFVELAEYFWHSSHGRGIAEHLLAKAFVRYRDDPVVAPILVRAVERWMGIVHWNGPYAMLDEAQLQEVRNRMAQKAGATLTPGVAVNVGGATLWVVDDNGLTRLRRLGWLVISARSRLPYLGAVKTWAIASAVAGGATDAPEAQWVLRFAEPEFGDAVLVEAKGLLDSGSELSTEAGRDLLRHLHTAAAHQVLREYPREESEFARKRRERHQADPCTSGEQWSEEECRLCMEREDLRPEFVVRKLRSRLTAPDFGASASLIDRAAKSLESLDPALLRGHMSSTDTDYLFRELKPLLASSASKRLGKFVRAAVRSLPQRAELGQRMLAMWLREATLILTQEELAAIREVLSSVRRRLQAGPEAGKDFVTIEEFLFLAELPHLTARERYDALLVRPSNAADLLDLQIWFASLSAADFHQALRKLSRGSEPHTIRRALWFLARSDEPLTLQESELVCSFMNCSDASARGACMRFASLRNDASVGRHIVDLGLSFHGDANWEPRWGAEVTIRFSDHLPFEEVARRLHPALAGYLLEERGFRHEEVELYANALHRGWTNVIGAHDPALTALPVVLAKPQKKRLETHLPEFADDEEQGVTIVDPSYLWGGQRSGRSIIEAFKSLQTDQAERLNREAKERVEAIIAAWKTEALQWFGRDFSRAALRAIQDRFPEFTERWVEPALASGIEGRRARLRFGSFLLDLCAVLLEREPAKGLRLWKALHSEENVPIRFNTAEEAFAAPNSLQADEARDQVFNERFNDLAIAQVAVLAMKHARVDWLMSAVHRAVKAKELWVRAKGLLLASYSDLRPDEFVSLLKRANVTDTWVEQSVDTLQANLMNNSHAKHWYHVYLRAVDADEAWGAFEMLLDCADERFYWWKSGIEADLAPQDLEAKQRFIASNWQRLDQALKREPDRKEQLFGKKFSAGQIFPFVRGL